MRNVVILVFLCVMVGFMGIQSAQCENMIVDGQEVDESGLPVATSYEIAPLDISGFLDFDDFAPCAFSQTIPIPPTFYKHFGFTINGPNAKSGGAVLHECSSFNVTGHSSPHFLAFNCGSTLATGGVPFLPEKIIFTTPVSGVSMKIGSLSSAGQSITVTATTAMGGVVDIENVVLDPALATINLTSAKSNIKKVVIKVSPGSNACVLVIDDITLTP
jgi:hypothetical protein